MALKYFFDFKNLGHGKKEITEPQGMDAADFKILRQDNGLGIDVTYAGQEGRFVIGADVAGHEFDRIIQYWDLFGQEAIVYFGIEFDDTDAVIGQVDFNTCETDRINTFEFSVKQIGKVQLFNLRYDVPTNLLDYRTLDDKLRDPIKLYKVLAPAKPVVQYSSWNTPAGSFIETTSPYTDPLYFNFTRNQVRTGVSGSTSYLITSNNASNGAFKYLKYIIAETRLTNVKIDIEPAAVYKYLPTGNIQDQKGQIRLFAFWGQNEVVGNYQSRLIWESQEFSGTNSQQQTLPQNLSITIPVINQTETLWIGYVSANRNASRNRIEFGDSKINISATSTAYDSTIQMCRVYDVMVENAYRTSEMPVSAPRWQNISGMPDGEFYNDFMTTQNMMRNLDKPLNITTKEIVEDYMPFCNGGYTATNDDGVYYRRYPDFFRNIEVGNFPQSPTEEYNESLFDEADVNRLSFGFTTFQSQKENENANTQDEVHGNLQDLLPSKQAQNKKDIKVGGVMSAFSLEDARRKAYNLEDTAATQDDSKKYYVYCVPLASNDPKRTQKQTATLQHDGDGLTLKLTNQGAFSWVLLGIETGSPFTVNSNENPGTYTVIAVTDRVITLQAQGVPFDIPTNNTTFTYRVGASTTHVWETDQFLDGTPENISYGDNYINLRRTARRCVLNYYSEFLATNLINVPFGDIKNTEYNNNPSAVTRFIGDEASVREGASYRTTGAILGTKKHTDLRLVMTIKEFLQLQKDIISKRGFIRVKGANGYDLKVFPFSVVFTMENDVNGEGLGFALLTGVEKYERDVIRIFKDGNNITINEQIMPSGIEFEIDDYSKFHIFATDGRELFPAVLWNRVSVNGVIPETEYDLQQVLQ